jgi:hypothetical protein
MRFREEVAGMAESKRRSEDKLPKDVSRLTGDELMGKVFSPEVVDELKKAAHEKDPKLSSDND